MQRVVHFELPADDPERIKHFYHSVFGWTIKKWDGVEDYWLVTTGTKKSAGINGGIMRRQLFRQSAINTIDVASLEDAISKIKQAGGKVVVSKMTVPTVGYKAYCQDTEGNVFAIIQPDVNAHIA